MDTPRDRKRLYLHIGHGKTGSSFLQTCFASSIEILDAAGISYPIDAAALARARDGHTTEGNFPPISLQLGHSIETLKAMVAGVPEGKRQRILISNEGLFQSIVLKEFLKQITEAFDDYTLYILLFIRDPFEHLFSAYQELLKADVVEEVESLFKKSSVPKNVGMALDKAAEVGASVTVFNFDRHRNELKDVAESWLGLEPNTLKSGPRLSVNRSMDRSEILLQRTFNKYVGHHARRFVADALAAELPDVKPMTPFIEHGILADFIERMNGDTLAVNARIPDSEHYRVPNFDEAVATLPSEHDAQKIEISLEQLDILARNICKFLPADWHKDKSEDKT